MSVEITKLRGLDNLELKRARCAGQRFPLHFHDTLSVGVVAEGQERITLGGETQIVGPGDVVVLEPGQVHAHAGVGAAVWQYCAMYVSPDVVARRRRALGVDARPLAQVIESPGLYHRLLEVHRGGAIEGVTAIVDELLIHHTRPRGPTVPVRVEVREAGTYVRRHHARKLAVAELAARCGLGPYPFVRAFRRAFGMTPTAFQIVERINRAQQLLADGATVVAAGLETGFYDQSHFVRFFRKFTGTTPIAYRTQASARSYKPPRGGSLSSRHDREPAVLDRRAGRAGRLRAG